MKTAVKSAVVRSKKRSSGSKQINKLTRKTHKTPTKKSKDKKIKKWKKNKFDTLVKPGLEQILRGTSNTKYSSVPFVPTSSERQYKKSEKHDNTRNQDKRSSKRHDDVSPSENREIKRVLMDSCDKAMDLCPALSRASKDVSEIVESTKKWYNHLSEVEKKKVARKQWAFKVFMYAAVAATVVTTIGSVYYSENKSLFGIAKYMFNKMSSNLGYLQALCYNMTIGLWSSGLNSSQDGMTLHNKIIDSIANDRKLSLTDGDLRDTFNRMILHPDGDYYLPENLLK